MANGTDKLVVIGASAGGMQPLIEVIKGLPADFSAPVLVIQHLSPHVTSNLARVLGGHTGLPVRDAEHEARIEPGTIYTAVSDHHLLVEGEHMLVTKGPKENRFRPSVDALFRSAAYSRRGAVIGIILSGALNDGTSGMWSVKRFGGECIVQKPETAAFASMPQSVLRYVEVDHQLEASAIGPLLARLCKQPNPKTPQAMKEGDDRLTELEVAIAKGDNALMKGVLEAGEFSPLTCPDCHGALTRYAEGPIKRYRCHTGHAFTTETLLTGIDDNIEKTMWEVMRGMEEGKLLLDSMITDLKQRGLFEEVAVCRRRAEELVERSQLIKEIIFGRRGLDAGLLTRVEG